MNVEMKEELKELFSYLGDLLGNLLICVLAIPFVIYDFFVVWINDQCVIKEKDIDK